MRERLTFIFQVSFRSLKQWKKTLLLFELLLMMTITTSQMDLLMHLSFHHQVFYCFLTLCLSHSKNSSVATVNTLRLHLLKLKSKVSVSIMTDEECEQKCRKILIKLNLLDLFKSTVASHDASSLEDGPEIISKIVCNL